MALNAFYIIIQLKKRSILNDITNFHRFEESQKLIDQAGWKVETNQMNYYI